MQEFTLRFEHDDQCWWYCQIHLYSYRVLYDTLSRVNLSPAMACEIVSSRIFAPSHCVLHHRCTLLCESYRQFSELDNTSWPANLQLKPLAFHRSIHQSGKPLQDALQTAYWGEPSIDPEAYQQAQSSEPFHCCRLAHPFLHVYIGLIDGHTCAWLYLVHLLLGHLCLKLARDASYLQELRATCKDRYHKEQGSDDPLPLPLDAFLVDLHRRDSCLSYKQHRWRWN